MCFLRSFLWFSSFSLWSFHGKLAFFNFVVGSESREACIVKFLFKKFFCSSCFAETCSSSQIFLLQGASRGRGQEAKCPSGFAPSLESLPQLKSLPQPRTSAPSFICLGDLYQRYINPFCHQVQFEQMPVFLNTCVRVREWSVGHLLCLWCLLGVGCGWQRKMIEASANCCPGLDCNSWDKKDLLWRVYLVSDVLLNGILTVGVMDWGQKKGRFVGKGNILH